MKQYNYVILDWDGTLAKTLDIWLDASREVLASKGLHPSDVEIGASFGAFTTYYRAHGLPPEATLDEVDRLAKRQLPYVELYTGAVDLLVHLRAAGKKSALVTSSLHENIVHLLERYQLIGLIDGIVAADDITHHKPHPEPLEKALQQLGGSKDQAVIVGDSDKDLDAATNFGIDSILFHEPSHDKFYPLADLQKLHPTHIVNRLEDIKKIVTLSDED